MNKVSKKTAHVPAVRKKGTVGRPGKEVGEMIPTDPQQAILVRAIVDPSLPIERMERLVAMYDKMKAEWARDQFFEALAGFQSECPVIEKRKTAKIRSKKGEESSFSYKYAAIEDLVEPVKPLFAKWGLSWSAEPEQVDGKLTVHLHVHHKAGHEKVTNFTIPIDPESYMSDSQKAGAALTFATRYAFKAAFGINARGDDNEEKLQGEGRRAPIQPPRVTAPVGDAVPVVHSPGPLKQEFDELIGKTVNARGIVINVWSEMERKDWAAKGNLLKGEERKAFVVELRNATEAREKTIQEKLK